MGEMKTPRWRMLQELHHQTILHYQNRKGMLNKNKKKKKKKEKRKTENVNCTENMRIKHLILRKTVHNLCLGYSDSKELECLVTHS